MKFKVYERLGGSKELKLSNATADQVIDFLNKEYVPQYANKVPNKKALLEAISNYNCAWLYFNFFEVEIKPE